MLSPFTSIRWPRSCWRTSASLSQPDTVNPPVNDAWMASRRTELANLCRYALEQQHANSTGQVDLADALAIYVNALAEELLADLGEPRSAGPGTSGFNGN